MPSNRFPDSREKRALRRRDAWFLEGFVKNVGHTLDYCGMPSVEFLDVEAWLPSLRSVVAVEYDAEVANDMRIERDRQQLPFGVRIVEDEMSRFLIETDEVFDVYNLDLYTGFVNPQRKATSGSVAALRAVFGRQSQQQRSFVLITTFNVRDKGADEYLKFLESAKRELRGRAGAEENLAAHMATQATRLKICFPFFCWQQAHALGFEQEIGGVYIYRSTATMVHFHQRFMYRTGEILRVPALRALIAIANLPLYEQKAEIPYRAFTPPVIAE